jgi:hypothetical protein
VKSEAADGETGVADVEPWDGAGGDKPQWVDLPGEAAGCKVQRLANPEQVHVVDWIPCDGIDGCEWAKYPTGVVGAGRGTGGFIGSLQGKTVVSHFVKAPSASGGAIIYATEEGQALDGFRPDPSMKECLIGHAPVGPNGYGAPIWVFDDKYYTKSGGIVVRAGSEPVLFTLPPSQTGAAGSFAMSATRWAWTWVMPSRLTSISATDGSDFRLLRTAGTGGVFDLGAVRGCHGHFVFDEDYAHEAGVHRVRISITDGLTEASPYLSATNDDDLLMRGDTGTHVAWLRAVNKQDSAVYERLELWASPFSPDPAQLKPEKIGDCAGKYVTVNRQASGFGYYSSSQILGAMDFVQETWDIAAKSVKRVPYPPGVGGIAVVGMTQSHAWVSASNPVLTMYRFAVK